MDRSPGWDEMEEIFAEPPSPLTFRALGALLDTWPGDDAAAAIAEAERRLAAWPDQDRRAPWSWLWALAWGYTKPTWALVRSLEMEPSEDLDGWPEIGHIIHTREAPLARLAGRPELRGVTDLRLCPRARRAVTAFRDTAESWPNLTTLQIMDDFNTKLDSLAALPVWSRLREMHAGLPHGVTGEPSLVPETPAAELPWEAVTLQADDLMAIWDRRALPRLRDVTVAVVGPEEAERLARRPEMAALTSLTLVIRRGPRRRDWPGFFPPPRAADADVQDDRMFGAFFAHARLPALERLTVIGHDHRFRGPLERHGLNAAGLEAFLRGGLPPRLTRLRLETLPLGDAGVAAIAEALPTDRLMALELVDVECGPEGATTLSRSRGLHGLEALDLSQNGGNAEAAARLAGTPMPRLRRLDLSGSARNPYYSESTRQPVGDDGAAAWASSPNAEGLEELRLSACGLTDAGLRALAAAPGFGRLSRLDLSHSGFSAEGLGALAASRAWASLRQVHLHQCRVDDAGIRQLTRIQAAPRLRLLGLAYNSIGPDGARTLADWPVLGRLWRVSLHDNFIGEAGLIALARSPYATRLLELDMVQDCWNGHRHRLGMEAADGLSDSRSLSRLDALYVGIVDEYHWAGYHTGFTTEAWQRLRASARLRPEARALLELMDREVKKSEDDADGQNAYDEEKAFAEEILAHLREGVDFRHTARD